MGGGRGTALTRENDSVLRITYGWFLVLKRPGRRDGATLPGRLDTVKGAVENGSAESVYYNFVDRFDMLGVGKDVPVATGNLSEGLLVLVDGKFMTLRVPYPMGFYAKGVDGRIDDPKAGWKGKGLYTPISTRAPFHMEGGKGTTSKLVKFQMRPDPLAN